MLCCLRMSKMIMNRKAKSYMKYSVHTISHQLLGVVPYSELVDLQVVKRSWQNHQFRQLASFHRSSSNSRDLSK